MPSAKRRALWSAHADNDLLDIWDYLAAEASPRVADKRVRAILDASDMLADWPRSGRRRESLGRGLRSFAVPPHVIFYRLKESRPEIVRVLHGHRDIERIFLGED